MAELLVLGAVAALFLLVVGGVVGYAMWRPDEFFADAPCVRMVAILRARDAASRTHQTEDPKQ